LTVTWLAAYSRHSRTVDKVIATFSFALFAYSLADWLGWLPFERGFQPLRMVLLSGALVLQPVASLLRDRSMLLHFSLLAASIVLLMATLATLAPK
jgi:hypothetical protein